MRFRCADLHEDGRVEVRDVDSPDDAWLRQGRPHWLDVEVVERDGLRELLAPLGPPSDILDGLISGVRPSQEQLAADWRAFRVGLPDKTVGSPRHLSVLVGPSIVVSVHKATSSRLSSRLLRSIDGTTLPVATLSGLLNHVLTVLQEAEVADYFELRDELDGLSASLDEVPDEADVEGIVVMKRRVAEQLSRCEDHIYITGWLWDLEQMQDGRMAESYRIMYQGLDRFRSVLSRGERRLQDLHQQYQLTLQETTNSRLRVLTVLSAIFMPMTLIAGIYGMNFDHMPELDERWAYFIVLAGMGALGLTMMLFFWVRGWFK